jgi:hypothetical protein
MSVHWGGADSAPMMHFGPFMTQLRHPRLQNFAAQKHCCSFAKA